MYKEKKNRSLLLSKEKKRGNNFGGETLDA